MPRGKYVNHKGSSRHFTSPEQLQLDCEEVKSSSSDKEPGAGTSSSGQDLTDPGKVPTSESDSEDKSDDSGSEMRNAKKGVTSLIQIENPNRVNRKTVHKLSGKNAGDLGGASKPELSRREREQIEKQKARHRYEKLHAQGKTAEAKADLARLALIRQQREEAAAKREAEKKAHLEGKKPDSSRFKII
ncbi:uncharacterized protein Dana_GF18397 [Drosophila ananassae]|uniref:Casein kinase substrate phosphoprotein PP28 domain-containing protein n=1 Tax=Drosophila ananassae TaxID=7217 RepID=B3M1F8_DROAN|nr:28 kDa heat- and acid-stable phosphoprotein [Drosophila ananassae]EDV43249.1 uncharacterized protein Dana_GF18397 [Drosophila ananassae]